jgi:hypothetical protein
MLKLIFKDWEKEKINLKGKNKIDIKNRSWGKTFKLKK